MCKSIYLIFSSVIVWLQETHHTNYVFFNENKCKVWNSQTVGSSAMHAEWSQKYKHLYNKTSCKISSSVQFDKLDI